MAAVCTVARGCGLTHDLFYQGHFELAGIAVLHRSCHPLRAYLSAPIMNFVVSGGSQSLKNGQA